MNIGFLTSTYPPNINGQSFAVESLKQALESVGHKVFVATSKVPGAHYPSEVLGVRSFRLPPSYAPENLYCPILFKRQALNFFRDNNVQVIHNHDTFLIGNRALSIARKLRVPLIHTYHTMFEEYRPLQFLPNFKKIVRQTTLKVCQAHDLTLTPSIKMFQYLVDLGIAESELRTMPYILNFTYLNRPVDLIKIDLLRFEYGINPKDFVFLAFSRISKEKDIDLTIKLLQPILQGNSRAKLVIAGNGPEEVTLKNLVSTLNLQNQVIFIGGYTHQNLLEIINLGSVYVFTSTFDTSAITLSESLFGGLPSICIDSNKLNSLAESGINGYYGLNHVQFQQVCLKVFKDQKLLTDLQSGARKVKDLYFPNDIIAMYVNMYRQVITKERVS